MKTKRNIIIDCDPGVDDAIALMYAIKSEAFNIKLITSTGGNSPIENITSNAIHLLELFESEIPVSAGSRTPLNRPATHATKEQGKNGLGNYAYNKKKLHHTPISEEACDAIYNVLKSSKSKTTIISTGPMTNLAKMLLKYPDSKNFIQEIVFESGTKEKIHGTPYKSFNAGYDPEATEIVLKSGVKIVMIPMELGHFAYLDKNDIKLFKNTNKPGKIFAKMFKGYRDYHVNTLGAAVHDVCTIFYLTHPEYVKTEATRR